MFGRASVWAMPVDCFLAGGESVLHILDDKDDWLFVLFIVLLLLLLLLSLLLSLLLVFFVNNEEGGDDDDDDDASPWLGRISSTGSINE
jgi:hypothetical protein